MSGNNTGTEWTWINALSGVALLYDDVVARFDGGQLTKVGLKCRFLSFVCLERCLIRQMEGLSCSGWRCTWFCVVLVSSLVTSSSRLHRRF